MLQRAMILLALALFGLAVASCAQTTGAAAAANTAENTANAATQATTRAVAELEQVADSIVNSVNLGKLTNLPIFPNTSNLPNQVIDTPRYILIIQNGQTTLVIKHRPPKPPPPPIF